MNIQDLLLEDVMIMDLKATTEDAAIDEMVDRYYEKGVINDKKLYKDDIVKREQESTTGIGDGIAMPHAQDKAVQRTTVLFAKSNKGVDFNALDKQPVYLFFMFAAPEGANNAHLEALAALSSLLINPDLVAALKTAKTPAEVKQLFGDAEAAKEKKDADDAKKQAAAAQKTDSADKPFIVAVSACPNGIAHTYMAEAALQKAAEAADVDIKVETNGSEGVKHKLTADDIKRARGVIVTADKKVAMDRFDGKHLLNRPVIDGINKPDELIKETLDDEGPIYHAKGGAPTEEADAGQKKSAWSNIYAELMNGISNMLPFVVGGGILMAISFMVEQWLGKTSGTFLFLNQLGNWAFSFLIPVLAAYIAEAIGDRPALMPGFVGGFMANTAAASFVKTTSVAGFLGGLAAGFIAGYVTVWLKHVFRNLPHTLEGLKPMIFYPILGLLLTGLAMYFVIDPVFAVVNSALTHFLNTMGTGNEVLLGAILGGMMSVDMGGPFNKSAYAFAIGVYTATGSGKLMAAVMVGGMIPPLATAIATTFWKDKFTPDEQKAGISNYILGASFITEGAIPFAASDPLHVITSCVIGSVIGGGLSQFWHVSVPAPHGGIWVTLLAQHPIYYLLSVIIGAVIAGVILGVWKPKKDVSKAAADQTAADSDAA
ncbi:fructose-specific phosphotransferase system, enzyme IIABC [Lactobacillus selangorensis]|uniref:Fructose-specific phosphotransferase system, enzyme IIABC n=1 Tax=Lactobacillus selangorensis TaxID=81857 RepID=A0A0R2G0M5_9LACO|nr:fructose-specific PTS transporter subunit EIIC [Lactobacillus selangorensis]KRN29415.1 fructose-specific phosphotransferase system, enzyme IIABC [Lactobacillus selangorensis]KRN34056.1 fructose-specific phosphotransferase system, enzyme IIABC [Lactobacillus selangorensis]